MRRGDGLESPSALEECALPVRVVNISGFLSADHEAIRFF